ncbi:MAG: hypothetical protein HY831_02790 [Candidatus Aenigmarchaeota archaeon]|nr:hypothetical protein [Candidatus Aenigmarchaeota archaeon]
MIVISEESFVQLPILLILGITLIFVAILFFSDSYTAIAKEKEFQRLTTVADVIDVKNATISLSTECAVRNSQSDLSNLNDCEYYKYSLSIKNVDITYNKPGKTAVSVAMKDYDEFVLYKYGDKDFANVQQIDAQKGLFIDINDFSFNSARAPILNFVKRTEYSGHILNQESIRLGEFSIIAATSFLDYFRDRPNEDLGGYSVEYLADKYGFCKADFFINCGNTKFLPGEFTRINVPNGESKNVVLCNGNLQISVGPEGSKCYLGKICSVDIKQLKEPVPKLYNYGEKVDISFWRLGNDDNGDKIVDEETESNFQVFNEKCSGKRWIDNKYCKDRLIYTKTFYADVGETTDNGIPRGC